MKRLVYGFGVAVVGLTLSLSAPMAEATGNAQQVCPPDAVLSGDLCMDKFEASVWQTTNANLINRIRRGTATLSRLKAGGAIQLGLAAGDLAAAGCPQTGNGCTNVFAVSIPRVTPSRFITWFQAAAAARNSGKHLPSNAEWQAAALGTPDGAPCIVSALGPGPTGTAGCVSDAGAFDLVGNLQEWVADWVPQSTICVNELFSGTNDFNCLAGADTMSGPGALIRGGDFANRSGAGVFAVRGDGTPSLAFDFIGFRAAR